MPRSSATRLSGGIRSAPKPRERKNPSSTRRMVIGRGQALRVLARPRPAGCGCICGRVPRRARHPPENQRFFATKDGLQATAFPHPHAKGDMARAILAESAHFGLKLVHGLFETAQPVAARIVPCGRKDHRGGEKLGAGQFALAAVHGKFIVRQAPAGVERLAKDAGRWPIRIASNPSCEETV